MERDLRAVSATESRRGGLAILALALVPALAAVWAPRSFVTQDGPAHLYNAQILLRSLQGDPGYRAVYEVRWQPLPNWVGHLVLMGLLAVWPAGAADKMMISLSLAAVAAGTFWLRGRVAGARGLPTAALLAVFLALNFPWLLGFYGFLLGAALYPVTLGVWWSYRERTPAPGC